ncbi:DUF1998 domain-containing protein [Rubellimicrobium roseum]|uniref:DUF1998 domain-containing protein n=1 Tax=Rubellimicrobium roseum TaxID=687525 RepID=A0A5C4NL00_9RHOB|nr:DUF1998 domain-containing protein [Rubellimicrobium roseum]TNC74575.1 DUF1998 domain-containing protein [Rubellimicrobium roseum]
MTNDVTQGFSQFLYTYGPGAMMDLPDIPVIVAGLQDWRMGGEETSHIIEEFRLTRLLAGLNASRLAPGSVPVLRTPPLHDPDRQNGFRPGVEVRIFPEWFVLEEAEDDAAAGPSGETRRRMVEFRNLVLQSDGSLRYQADKRKVRVSPVRFVAACPEGHLKDINWRRVVHGADPCSRPLYWAERGASSDPTDVTVRCACTKSVSLANLHVQGRLGTCDAFSPWLTPRHQAEDACDQELRLLARSATNAYFPQTVSVISMPIESDAAAQAVSDHWSTIAAMRGLPNLLDILRALPATASALKPFSDADILAAIAGHGTSPKRSPDPRIEEFDRFSANVDIIGREGADSRLLGRRLTLDPSAMPKRIAPLLAMVVRVDRLREVACLYGFTRLDAAPSATESELDEITLATKGAPLEREPTWFPTVEQFGEGIFIRLDSAAIQSWSGREVTRDRAKHLKAGERRDAERRGREPEHLGTAYWAIHGLSHALMIELSLEAGYPLSSLKERIYASKTGAIPRHGILIYTATSGGQGTLGGLCGMAEHIPRLLDRALERLATCSNDPVCFEHEPDDPRDDRNLHGAACHACLLVPETSCEARNGRLDRVLLVGAEGLALASAIDPG